MRDFTELELTRAVNVIDAPQRARLTWFRIQWEPVSVVMTRPRVVMGDGTVIPETVLGAQVIRIEGDSRANLVQAVAGSAPIWQAVIIGIKDHPTIADTDMDQGYIFVHEGNVFRITEVWKLPGLLRGVAMVNG